MPPHLLPHVKPKKVGRKVMLKEIKLEKVMLEETKLEKTRLKKTKLATPPHLLPELRQQPGTDLSSPHLPALEKAKLATPFHLLPHTPRLRERVGTSRVATTPQHLPTHHG